MPLLTGSFRFNPAESVAVMNDKRQYSIIQLFARKVDMTWGGSYVTIFDTDVDGAWVGQETGRKPTNEQVVSNTSVAVYEWATVIPISNRVVESDPAGVMAKVKSGAYASMNRAFDRLAFQGAVGLGTSVADSLASVTNSTPLQNATGTGDSNGTWTGLNNGLKLLTDQEKEWGGSIWDARTEVIFNTDVDGNNRPLFVDVPLLGTTAVGNVGAAGNRPGRVLGRPADFARGVSATTGALGTNDVVGYAGDWSRAVWGTVGDVNYSISTEASWWDPTANSGAGGWESAFQRNVTLIRVEAFLGFKVLDPDAFVKFTLGATS